ACYSRGWGMADVRPWQGADAVTGDQAKTIAGHPKLYALADRGHTGQIEERNQVRKRGRARLRLKCSLHFKRKRARTLFLPFAFSFLRLYSVSEERGPRTA